MNRPIRVGTRASDLALFQANLVKQAIERLGYSALLVPITSSGDLDLNKPLYEMGITGIFTKALDAAMLSDTIDIAVHSMKDVPTALPEGIVKAAVLEREDSADVLLVKDQLDFSKKQTIATGSLRRKAQWLSKFPHHKVENIRGNLKLRLQKLDHQSAWKGAIFAKAGINRMSINTYKMISLEWMIPAPAQGAIVVTAREDSPAVDIVSLLNHEETDLCTHVERQFLSALEGGCTAPIGASAKIKDEVLHFNGVLLNVEGTKRIDVNGQTDVKNYMEAGRKWAEKVKQNGGQDIIEGLRKRN